MIILWFAFLLITSSCGLPQQEVAKILKYNFQNEGTGNYYFQYATSDGQAREEKGELKDENTEDEHIVIRGSYSYMGPDGVMYEVRYVADDAGFHPEGDHIKVPPFVPWIKGAHSHHHDGKYHPEDHGDNGHYHPERHNYDDGTNYGPNLPSVKPRTGARKLDFPSLSTLPPYPSRQEPSVPFPTIQSLPSEKPSEFQGYSTTRPSTPFITGIPSTTYGPTIPPFVPANSIVNEVSQNKPIYIPSTPKPFVTQYNSIDSTFSQKPSVGYIPSSSIKPPINLGAFSSNSPAIISSSPLLPPVDFNKPSVGAYIPSSTVEPQVTVSITPKPTYIPNNTNIPITRHFRSSKLKRKTVNKESQQRDQES